MRLFVAAGYFFLSAAFASAQSIDYPWSGHAHDPQHTGISPNASQPFARIKWSMPVDLAKVYQGKSLLIHYGAPLNTRQNTLIVPVKTGATDGFRIEARDPADGAEKWTITSDYQLPPHDWVPSFGIALSPKNRLFFPRLGGTIGFRDSPDDPSGTTGRLIFFGAANYNADPGLFDGAVKINTPITVDRYGNIYFGFQTTSATANPSLQSGIARIAEDGTGSWVGAKVASGDNAITKVVHNCAPALSNDQKILYFAVSSGTFTGGYLVSVDSRTLAPIAKVRLRDVLNPTLDSYLSDDGSTAPTVGPDGDVYFGVLENGFGSNNGRGYLRHFNAALTQSKPAGGFGWDDTASIVPASLVPSYTGTSEYLLLTKYNDYAGYGSGQGFNQVAVLDPNATMISPINGAAVMQEVLTVLSPTLDNFPAWPDARREWCINTAAIDPATKSALVSCEDGKTYRWSFVSNTLSEVMTLTSGIGEAYTPTIVGVDGTVYAIADGTLYAIGNALP